MSEEQRWKTKYLESLEQQERIEQRWETRLDLLRRGLVRSSLAAEGSDKAVDQCMKELRNVMRSESMDAALSSLIPRLEKAVLDSEQRREQRGEMVAQSLTAIASQLQTLELPRDVSKPLKSFSRRVSREDVQGSELPALLAELARLQAQALDRVRSEVGPRPGLLQRLFGTADTATPPEPPSGDNAPGMAPVPQPTASDTGRQGAADAVQPSVSSADPIDPPVLSAIPADNVDPVDVAEKPATPTPEAASELAGDPAYGLPQPPEPGYSAVAPHIAASLTRLLDELSLPEQFKPQAESLRTRVSGGLNWYELVPLLDDLGVLVLAVSGDNDHAFARYLAELNERLATFMGGLNQTQTDYSASISDARALDDELREQVSDLQASVQQASDLESLKRTVDSRLDGLLGTMNTFQQRNHQREQEIGERLQTLMARVSAMEQEARTVHLHLEEQRLKALTDALTGLPNRAAWTERAELEEARWQRYGGDLLVAVLDVDHFKRINDDFGHLAGDKVLKIIAQELQKRLRKTDFIARFGGEEFAVLLPATTIDAGHRLLDSLREQVARCPFHFKGQPVSITFSSGITWLEGEDTVEAAFERADQALYQAKRSGRNRVERA
ncbi:GGDEF domain-containing protein [Pseudomonas sp. Marseille-QA0892]